MADPHEELLAEWRSRYPRQGFVTDGILDCDRWSRGPRVAFLLKEAYGEKDSPKDWDLRAFLRQGYGKDRMWNNASHWAHVIGEVSLPVATRYADLGSHYDECRDALLGSAVINIKKIDGRSESSNGDLKPYVARDRDLLVRQIALIGPRVLIAGRTWSLVKDLWPRRGTTVSDAYYCSGMIVVDFAHPTTWTNKEGFYNQLDRIARGLLAPEGLARSHLF